MLPWRALGEALLLAVHQSTPCPVCCMACHYLCCTKCSPLRPLVFAWLDIDNIGGALLELCLLLKVA